MPIQNFNQQPRYNTQADACCVDYSESQETILKSVHLTY